MFFFFQAEDGIRDLTVTGVQTCALPISSALRQAYEEQWHRENDPKLGERLPFAETTTFTAPHFDGTRVHLWNFFEAVRTRKPVVEDVVFGHHAALACHMANESYFRRSAVTWDEASKTIK